MIQKYTDTARIEHWQEMERYRPKQKFRDREVIRPKEVCYLDYDEEPPLNLAWQTDLRRWGRV